MVTVEYLVGGVKPSEKYYPGKRPQTVWGGKRILHYNMDDDDHDDEDDDDWRKMMIIRMMMRMRMGWDGDGDDDDDDDDDDDWEEDDDVDVEEEDRSQDQEAHFVRACAVEMHMDIWQEPLCGNLQEKSRGKHFVRACAIKTHMDIWEEPFCVEIYRKNACASLRSRNAHGHFRRAILCGNLQGKCRTPRRPPRLNTGP